MDAITSLYYCLQKLNLIMLQDILDGKYKKIDDAVAEVRTFTYVLKSCYADFICLIFLANFLLNKDKNSTKTNLYD